ncbi:MAG: dapB [Gammaproteobacteria bacterium]|jgi:4-hydroxy-tetrahydrodipicolinate reductase|nr:dapB [Gammaproteobacteria bacterium]
MSIRVLVNGAGRMGQLAATILREHPDFILVGMIKRDDDLAAEIKKNSAQIVIDFTQAEAVLNNTRIIIETGAHPIIGTSGLLQNQVKQLQIRCTELGLGGLIVPNFSLAAILMMKYAKHISSYFSQFEIIEAHHSRKLDSPSGTAIRTAEMLAETPKILPPQKKQHETIPHARGATHQHIPIHSIRLPGVLAQQQVIFGGEGETLTIQYNTIDQRCYVAGILLACQKVSQLNELVYGLEHLI